MHQDTTQSEPPDEEPDESAQLARTSTSNIEIRSARLHSPTSPLAAEAPSPDQATPTIQASPPTADPVAIAVVSNKERAQEEAEEEDLEKNQKKFQVLDIEHLKVDDDPRLWSDAKKNVVLSIVAFTAMGGTIPASIYFPALDSLQRDLSASSTSLALTVSLFTLGQGLFPQLWTAVSEVSGRKPCYLSALVIFLIATTVASRSKTISVFIAMRILQSLGGSAVLALGAGSLADIFDTHERGTKLGIFYSVPLVAPALGPILGGALTTIADWRSAFYFLIGYGAICFGLMSFIPNTFRKERSLAWRKAMERAKQEDLIRRAKAKNALPPNPSTQITSERKLVAGETKGREEGQQNPRFENLGKIKTGSNTLKSGDVKVKIHLRDINPFGATFSILRSPANALVLIYSALLFALTYTISYTAARSFSSEPYNYSAVIVGVVLLSFGVGNCIGSIGGGRWSDMVLKKLKAKNGGKGEPEMRIKSTYAAMVLLPPLLIAYAWLVEYTVNVAGPVVILFFLGAVIMVVYASTLAYLVDANPGRSTAAVATNSVFRGTLACISSQVSEDLLNKYGNGAFYTGFAVIIAVGQLALLVVSYRGQAWRERSREREEMRDEAQRLRREQKLRAITESR